MSLGCFQFETEVFPNCEFCFRIVSSVLGTPVPFRERFSLLSPVYRRTWRRLTSSIPANRRWCPRMSTFCGATSSATPLKRSMPSFAAVRHLPDQGEQHRRGREETKSVQQGRQLQRPGPWAGSPCGHTAPAKNLLSASPN